jgi:hypothetical protein
MAEKEKANNASGNNKTFNNIEQWILTQNIDKAAQYYEELAINDNDFKYYTFRQVNGPGPQLINRLRGIDDLSVFYRMKTSALSLLQPKLRIYKVTYEDFKLNQDGTVDQGSITPLQSPCYREFKFSDNFGTEHAASVQDYLSYETTKPTFRNAGLVSFDITQNGETHGAIENNIECKLSLSFKSLKDINASPPGEPSLRYVDLILWPPARFTKDTEKYNPKHYEIKVMMGYTAPSKQQLKGLNLSPAEEKALLDIEKLNQVVSLGLFDYDINIEENGSVKLTATYRGRLETVIGTNQVNIFQDSIRLGETGHFEITKEADSKLNIANFYDVATSIKAIHSGMKQTDCLKDCQEKKNLRSLTEKNQIFAKIVKDAMDNNLNDNGLKANGATLSITNENKYFTWFKSDVNGRSMMANIKRRVGFFKQQILLTFMDQLIEGDGTEDKKGRSRLFCLEFDSETMRESVEWSEEAGTFGGVAEAEEEKLSEVNEKINLLTTAVSEGSVGISFNRCEDDLPTAEELSNNTSALVSPSTGVAEESSSNESEDEGPEEETEEMVTPPTWLRRDGKRKFHFVFLGDIIELACKNARLGAIRFDNEIAKNSIFPFKDYVSTDAQDSASNYPIVNGRILLGPLDYVASDGEVKTINLARMPISFKNFNSWFMDTITKRRRVQMPLGDFLAKLVNDLVLPSLGHGMPESRKAPNTRASIVAVTLPGKIKKSPTVPPVDCGGKSIKPTEEALPLDRVLNTEDALFKEKYLKFANMPRSSESMIKTSYDYLLIYITSHKDITQRRGDPVEDIEDGIYHFNIGSDQGLLRKMDFSRVSLPFLAELRSEQAEEQGVDQLEQLKFPYDTDVYLVGTSLFVPGMFYYVNPSLAGLGSVENAASLAYQMNLGGYHLIGQVSTNIASGKFVTKLVGTQTSQGRR